MVSGMILSLAVGIAGIVAVGWLAKQTQAGAGIAELGKGISSFLSPQITPTFKPMVEIGIGPNIGGLISWLQESWGSVGGYWGEALPKIPTPILPTIPFPVLPKIPSPLPPGPFLAQRTFQAGLNLKATSPLRIYGIDGSRL